MDVSRIKDKKFRAHYAGYIIGPRLNASGRMGSAQRSLDLLLSQSVDEAQEIAEALDVVNKDRQKLQRSIIEDALDLVEHEMNFK
jgi:single-stranded-DNA-specific exonuclease